MPCVQLAHPSTSQYFPRLSASSPQLQVHACMSLCITSRQLRPCHHAGLIQYACSCPKAWIQTLRATTCLSLCPAAGPGVCDGCSTCPRHLWGALQYLILKRLRCSQATEESLCVRACTLLFWARQMLARALCSMLWRVGGLPHCCG